MEYDPCDPKVATICALKAHYIIVGFMHTIHALVESCDLEGLNELTNILREFSERKLRELDFKLENV